MSGLKIVVAFLVSCQRLKNLLGFAYGLGTDSDVKVTPLGLSG